MTVVFDLELNFDGRTIDALNEFIEAFHSRRTVPRGWVVVGYQPTDLDYKTYKFIHGVSRMAWPSRWSPGRNPELRLA